MKNTVRSMILLAVVICSFAAVAAPSAMMASDGGPIPCPPGRKCK